jgi:dipeptide/tripeptide permease
LEQIQVEEMMAYEVYGNFSKLVYFLPLLIGPFIDFGIGHKPAAVAGGLFSAFGALMLLHGDLTATYIGLGMLALGTSLSRLGNISVLGSMFHRSDNKRDVSFGILYLGINLGAIIATSVIALVGESQGFNTGFIICAGAGVLSAFTMFIGGLFLVPHDNDMLEQETTRHNDPSVLDLPVVRRVASDIPSNEKKFRWPSYVIIALFTITMWVIYEVGAGPLWEYTHSDEFMALGIRVEMLNPALLFLLLPLFVVLLYFVNKQKMKLHYMWLIVIGGVLVILASELISQNDGNLTPGIVIFHAVLATIVEVTYNAIGGSHVTRLSGPKWSATAYGCYLSLFGITQVVTEWQGELFGIGILGWMEIILVLTILGALILKLTGLKQFSF